MNTDTPTENLVDDYAAQASRARRNRLRLLVLGAIALCTLVIVTLYGGQFRSTVDALLKWTAGLGPLGWLVVALAYVPACVLLLPGVLLTLGSGFLFGVVTGSVVASLGSTAGAAAAFWAGRALAHDWVQQKVKHRASLGAVTRAVSGNGFKLVFLLRLSPVFPFNLLNYALSVTTIPFWKYLLASWIGMLPATILYVYLGSTARSLAAVAAGDVDGGWGQRIFLYFGLAVALFAAALITHRARRAVSQAVAAPQDERTS